MAHIEVAALTTFDVHPDGTHVRINVRDQSGLPASMVLPVACANELMMALPRLVEVALRNNHKNDGLRLVHPLACFYIEAGETSEEGVQQFILTIDTGKGFWLSFNVPEDMLKTLSRTIASDVIGQDLPEADLALH